ncbi:MAG: iron-sulfur cluster assembly accessory protein [Acidobacteriota bacterium]
MDTEKETVGQFSITLTDLARQKVLEALEKQPEKNALRLEARANGTPQFSYSMRLIGEADKRVDDLRIDSDGLELVIDPNSASNLNGASVDFEDRVVRSGFKFNNPNKPEVPEVGSGPRGDLTGSTAERVQQLLDRELNPAVAAHGGRINFVGVKDNKVYLSFGGGCHGCGMVDVTLKQGVEARIRELIPEIEEVVDTTDHSSGQNPFYA